MEITRLERRRATDDVYDSLRQAILAHVFQPGERLDIAGLSEKLGVSLTPVRTAIHRLAAEGLVDVHPRGGTYVAKPGARDIEETFEVRCALECLAAELAAPRIDEADLRRMRKLGASRAEADNAEFHAILLRASGNQRLVEMYESLRAHIRIARAHLAEGYSGERDQQQRAEHEAIVEALAARDAEAAKAALRSHIQRASKSLAAGIAGGGAA
jgi:DNA-binding GntR family transcriptional regulator